eukprot:406034-Pelagomonas_calceolata.AAC.1
MFAPARQYWKGSVVAKVGRISHAVMYAPARQYWGGSAVAKAGRMSYSCQKEDAKQYREAEQVKVEFEQAGMQHSMSCRAGKHDGGIAHIDNYQGLHQECLPPAERLQAKLEGVCVDAENPYHTMMLSMSPALQLLPVSPPPAAPICASNHGQRSNGHANIQHGKQPLQLQVSGQKHSDNFFSSLFMSMRVDRDGNM